MRRAAKVSILGAAGGIGQPLALLAKQSNHVGHLTLYDIRGTPGVAADLGHISSPAQVAGYLGEDLPKALEGRDVVIIPAGVPRKPGMTRDELFNTNASIVKSLAEACAKHCPNASILVIANPVNSTVPIVAEVFKKAGKYDPRKIFGVTTLDIMRARTFVASVKGASASLTHNKAISPTVIGGHSGPTIVPLLSHLKQFSFTEAEVEALTKRIQYGGDEVVKAKDGSGSATLSMAAAGWEFGEAVIRAQKGEKGITECTYVDIGNGKYFAQRTDLGKDGVEKIHEIGALSAFEQKLLEECNKELAANIKKGVEFVKGH